MTTGVPDGVRTFVLTMLSEVAGRSSGSLFEDATASLETVEETFIVIIPSPDTQPLIPMMRPVEISCVTPVGSSFPVSGSVAGSR